MKNSKTVEVILFINYSFNDLRQKELVRWLGTTAQPAIDRQQERVRKVHLKMLKDSPAIYMS